MPHSKNDPQTGADLESVIQDRITVRLNPDVRAALAKYCQLEQVKVSEVAQTALHRFFMEHDPEYADYIQCLAQQAGRYTAKAAGTSLYRDDTPSEISLNEPPAAYKKSR